MTDLVILARSEEEAAAAWQLVDPGFTQMPMLAAAAGQIEDLVGQNPVVVVVAHWQEGVLRPSHRDVARLLAYRALHDWTLMQIALPQFCEHCAREIAEGRMVEGIQP
jgi:hypothetical protein